MKRFFQQFIMPFTQRFLSPTTVSTNALQPISMEKWLAGYPAAWRCFQEGNAPFGLTYLDKASIETVNHLIERFFKNDEDRRFTSLTFKTHEERQAALKLSKTLLQENKNHEADVLLKTIQADQTAQKISAYRHAAQGISSSAFWNKKRYFKGETEREALTALQEKWQRFIPFAFCCSEDLLEKITFLNEIDAYVRLARSELHHRLFGIPLSLRRSLRQQFIALETHVFFARQQVALAMSDFITGISTHGDLQGDHLINQDVLPVLKRLGVVKNSATAVDVSSTLTAEKFSQMMAFIQRWAPSHQKEALLALPLFHENLSDLIPFTPIKIGKRWQAVPHALAALVPRIPSFLPADVFPDRHRQQQWVNWQRFYAITVWNHQARELISRITSPAETTLHYHLHSLQRFKTIESALQQEITKTLLATPRGIHALWYAGTRRLLTAWVGHLEFVRGQLFVRQVALARLLVNALPDPLDKTCEASSHLTPETYQQVREWVEELINALPTLPPIPSLQKDLQDLKKRFQEVMRIPPRFMAVLLNAKQFPLTPSQTMGIITHRPEAAAIEAWVNQCTAYVSTADKEAMQCLGKLVTGEAYPTVAALTHRLAPWFQESAYPETEQHAVIDALIDRYVIPAISRVSDAAYRFVESFDPHKTQQWLLRQQSRVEDAIQCLEKLFITHPSLGKPVILKEETVTTAIQTLISLSTPTQDHLQRLKTRVLNDIANNAPVLSEEPSLYHDAICQIVMACGDPHLLVSYGLKRFQALFQQQRYATLFTDRFLLSQAQDASLRKAIQAFLATTLPSIKPSENLAVMTVIQQWGSLSQQQLFKEQLDHERLIALQREAAHEDTITPLRHTVEAWRQDVPPFPCTPLGKKQLADWLQSFLPQPWQPRIGYLMECFADTALQQAYRMAWLKECLLSNTFFQAQAHTYRLSQPYEKLLLFFGERHVPDIHHGLMAYFNHTKEPLPEILSFIKTILSREWVQHHEAHDLAKTLFHWEAHQQLMQDSQSFIDSLSTLLPHGALTTVVEKINCFAKQATSSHPVISPVANTVLAQALGRLGEWLKNRLIESPDTFIAVQSPLLTDLPAHPLTETCRWLYAHADAIRFAHDRLRIWLSQWKEGEVAERWPVDAVQLHYLEEGLSVKHRHMLAARIDSYLVTLTSDNRLFEVLSALRRVLLQAYSDSSSDRNLITDFHAAHGLAATTPSVISTPSKMPVQEAVEEHFLDVIQAIAQGGEWETDQRQEVVDYYQLQKRLGSSSSQAWIIRMEKAYARLFETTCQQLQDLPLRVDWQEEAIAQEGQRLLGACYLIRAWNKPDDITVLDETVGSLQRAYYQQVCRHKNPDHWPLVVYEHVMEACGNAQQRAQSRALRQTREQGPFTALVALCRLALQEASSQTSTAETLSSTVAQSVNHFLGSMHTTWRQLKTHGEKRWPRMAYSVQEEDACEEMQPLLLTHSH